MSVISETGLTLSRARAINESNAAGQAFIV